MFKWKVLIFYIQHSVYYVRLQFEISQFIQMFYVLM